jgi:hypothetical protein
MTVNARSWTGDLRWILPANRFAGTTLVCFIGLAKIVAVNRFRMIFSAVGPSDRPWPTVFLQSHQTRSRLNSGIGLRKSQFMLMMLK